jgi:hypothetical protein
MAPMEQGIGLSEMRVKTLLRPSFSLWFFYQAHHPAL